MQQVEIYTSITTVVPVSLGFDVSQDQFISDVRVEKDVSSALIVSWDVSFLTDGTDGELILTLDAAVTSAITQSVGYMDLKRVSGGEPLSVFSEPLEVVFVNSITE